MISFPSFAQLRPPHRRLLLCAALALLMTLLNSLKPLHIDDAGWHRCAAHIAHDPLSPYDFEILVGQHVRPGNHSMAPPVLPYWWALGIRLFGDHPFLWKLWLLPFALLLVFALHALFRRFARGLELPLLTLAVLSPTLLPSFNLMADVPALAGGLTAVALFLRAADRGSVWGALAAGLVTGLAMQTKYSALLTPAVIGLYALLFQRIRLGALAVAVGLLVFVGWEGFIALRHGQSHFLASTQYTQQVLPRLGPMFRTLLSLAGGLAPVVAVLGLAALSLSGRVVLGSGAAVLLGYVGLACVPGDLLAEGTLSGLFCRLLGLLLAATLAAVTWRLLRPSVGQISNLSHQPGQVGNLSYKRRVEWFLVLWLAMEVAAYFVLSPFPAARRVLGIVVVATLLVGRLASRTCRGRRPLVATVAAGGALLGLAFYAVDLREAAAEKQAAELAHATVTAEGGGTTWYAGIWGFKFYAERAGMRPVLPDRSQLRKGDWLVVPESPIGHQEIQTAAAPLQLTDRLILQDRLPLRTGWRYYGGSVPLARHDGPRVCVRIYRVTADFVPATP